MNKVFREMLPLLEEEFESEKAKEVFKIAERELKSLCKDNKDEVKEVKAHTVKILYPTIAIYRGLLETGVDKNISLDFMDRSLSKRAEPEAKQIRMMLKIPFLYKLMPAVFKFVTLNQFGEKAGFKAKFYNMGKDRVKFDMTKCLYCEVCNKNGCPELTKCFCHTDDVKDGNMHPKLFWNRSKTMGEGQDVCDFDLIIKENK